MLIFPPLSDHFEWVLLCAFRKLLDVFFDLLLRPWLESDALWPSFSVDCLFGLFGLHCPCFCWLIGDTFCRHHQARYVVDDLWHFHALGCRLLDLLPHDCFSFLQRFHGVLFAFQPALLKLHSGMIFFQVFFVFFLEKLIDLFFPSFLTNVQGGPVVLW